MARVSQYKALGSALGGYKKTLSDVGAKEYAKQHESFKGEQQRAMYSAIGGTVANIIGIAGEAAKAKELKGYGESARQLRGIGERDVEYQPLGKFGEAIGLGPKTRKESFFHDTGQTLSERELQNIGYMESLGMETKYSQSKYAERPEVPITPAETELIPLEEKLTSTMTEEEQMSMFGKAGIEQGDLPEPLDPLYESETQTIGTYDPALELESMEGLPSLIGDYSGATTEGQRGAQSMKIGEGTVAGKETKGYQPWLPEGVDPEYAGMIERERDEPTPFGHVVKQRQREINNPSGNPESKVFEAIKGDDDKPITGYNAQQVKDIASQAVGPERADDIKMALGMESSFGQDPKAEGNILQIKNEGLLKEAGNIDLSDPKAVSEFYVKKTDEFTEGFSGYEIQTGTNKGQTIDVYAMMEKEGIPKSGVKYLTWQQGRGGVLDMATSLMEGGQVSDGTIDKMLNNVSEQQKKYLEGIDDSQKLVREWLKIQSEKMGKY